MRQAIPSGLPVVVKVGSSSLLDGVGRLEAGAMARVVDQVASQWDRGRSCVLVTSAAVAAGMAELGLTERPSDTATLQMAAAVGQTLLMTEYRRLFAERGRATGQVLITKDVLWRREQYLNAREAMTKMLDSGVVPVVNENDTVAIDELAFGDNDRLAAIASHLVGAGLLVILTDTKGLFDGDPRVSPDARLLDAVRVTDEVLARLDAKPGRFGSGGVATKLAAAQIASWSGIPTVIASASDVSAVEEAVGGQTVGTWIEPRARPLSARKLWIAFGAPARGAVDIDDGAVAAIREGGRSLLAAGVLQVRGDFPAGSAVEVFSEGLFVAKGLVRMDAAQLGEVLGQHSSLAGGEVIHRDDLVVST